MHFPGTSILSIVLKMKCPRCGFGKVFVNRNILPLSDCLKMHSHCSICGLEIKSKTDNAPSINYALSVIVYGISFLLYAALFGITYKDNSIYYSLITSTLLVIILQPWLLRYSKIIYLYLYIKFHRPDY